MDRRPTLLIISLSTLVSDARVLRPVRLFTREYAVTTVGHGPAPEGVIEHVRVSDEIISWHKDRRLLLLRRYQAAYETAPVTRHLNGRLGPGRWDVVLANDADTMPLAVSIRPRGGVHADLHEYASRQNEESRRWRWFLAPYRRCPGAHLSDPGRLGHHGRCAARGGVPPGVRHRGRRRAQRGPV